MNEGIEQFCAEVARGGLARFQGVVQRQQLRHLRHDALLLGKPAPKGLRHPAQGWSEATTLGARCQCLPTLKGLNTPSS